MSSQNNEEWIEWYYHGPGEREYPEPDYEAWHADLQEIHAGTDGLVPA